MIDFFIPSALAASAILETERQGRAARDAAEYAARMASCYQAGNWHRADDIIDVGAREVPEPCLLGHKGAAR